MRDKKIMQDKMHGVILILEIHQRVNGHAFIFYSPWKRAIKSRTNLRTRSEKCYRDCSCLVVWTLKRNSISDSLIFKRDELQATKDRHEILPDSRKVARTRRTPPNAGYHFSSSRCRRTWNAKDVFFLFVFRSKLISSNRVRNYKIENLRKRNKVWFS